MNSENIAQKIIHALLIFSWSDTCWVSESGKAEEEMDKHHLTRPHQPEPPTSRHRGSRRLDKKNPCGWPLTWGIHSLKEREILAESIGYKGWYFLVLLGIWGYFARAVKCDGSTELSGGGSKWCKHDLGCAVESKNLPVVSVTVLIFWKCCLFFQRRELIRTIACTLWIIRTVPHSGRIHVFKGSIFCCRNFLLAFVYIAEVDQCFLV